MLVEGESATHSVAQIQMRMSVCLVLTTSVQLITLLAFLHKGILI